MSSESDLNEWQLDSASFVALLEKLINETEHLQNAPLIGLVPQEALAARHVLDVLQPLSTHPSSPADPARPLRLEVVEYVPGRSNILLEYPASGPDYSGKCVSFVGSHLDVVPADPAAWQHHPFTFRRDGDTLYGRGTTDCLGHVALLTQLFKALALQRPRLNVDIFAVLIADEEAGSSSVGVEELCRQGKLSRLQRGPLFWLDCADCQPNIGTGGVVQWALTASGKLAHSGFPHHGVNAIELAMDAVASVQRAFYAAFPPHEKQQEYGYGCSSSMKPTKISSLPDGSLNQIPSSCTVQGDVRLVPFYRMRAVQEVVQAAVAALNQGLRADPAVRGPDSKYEGGSVALQWLGEPLEGLACDLQSPGYKCLCEATERIFGVVKPLADTGSLPLVAELQEQGFDVQTIGYGLEEYYHNNDEQARLSDFERGYRVLTTVIHSLSKQN